MEKTGNILLKYIPKKIKRKDLADVLGVKPQYLSNILNDKKKPSDEFLKNFYNLFNVTKNDIELISKYELFRKIPNKIKGEIIEIKENFTKFETLYIENKGILKDDNFIKSKNDEILTLKNNYMYNKIGESDFFVIIDTDKCSPFFKGDMIFFKKDFLLMDLNNKYVLIKYENNINIYFVKIIEKKIILNSLNNKNKSYILNDKKKIKIYGYAYSKISEVLI